MNAILILGAYDNTNLIDLTYDLGFAPIIKDEMVAALHALRHDDFAAIIIDKKTVDIDTLEFILNARDVYAQIPVLVLYGSDEADDDLNGLDQQKVFQLTDEVEDSDLEIARILQELTEDD